MSDEWKFQTEVGCTKVYFKEKEDNGEGLPAFRGDGVLMGDCSPEQVMEVIKCGKARAECKLCSFFFFPYFFPPPTCFFKKHGN